MEDHGNPAEEEVDVDRPGLGEEDDPSADCEGGPEERGAHAEQQGSATQLAGPERTTTGRARNEKEARHDPTASGPTLHQLLPGVREARCQRLSAGHRRAAARSESTLIHAPHLR